MKINKIIVHCSDSDIAAHDNIETIYQWHVIENGWSDVGYHYFIQSSGNLQKGRDNTRPGAHVRGHNQDSIGICLHGKNNFTEAQFVSLRNLIQGMLRDFNLTIFDVYGHRDFDNSKTCPNFDVRQKLIIGNLDPKTGKRI